MARIVENQTNLWGKQQGIEGQRSDLWLVDFRETLEGLHRVAVTASTADTETSGSVNLQPPMDFLLPKLATYYVHSVALPDLRVRSDAVRRDSRPYQMPTWDDPLDPIRMTFLLDCYKPGRETSPYKSEVYCLMDAWRSVVRAGRGSLSSEYAIRLDNDYRIDYAFNVEVKLLRPGSPQLTSVNPNFFGGQKTLAQRDQAYLGSGAGVYPGNTPYPSLAVPDALNYTVVQNDLQEALKLTLVKCWLSSFKVSDLSYEQAKLVQIEATLYAEDIQQEPVQLK